MQFVEIGQSGQATNAGPAPYLDYRPPTETEAAALAGHPLPDWLRSDLEARAMEHAAIHLVPAHLDEVRRRKEELIERTLAAVNERLTKEINYWDHRAAQLKDQELAGKVNAKLNSGLARQRADDLTARLQRRLSELEQERKLSALPPVVLGGALIVPARLLRTLTGQPPESPPHFALDTKESERRAMRAVMHAERELGFVPRDVSDQNLGYDIESSIPNTGLLRFLEVKGRVRGAKTVTITKNEILTGLNKPEQFLLAIVLLDPDQETVRYARTPFEKEPDFTRRASTTTWTHCWPFRRSRHEQDAQKGFAKRALKHDGIVQPTQTELDEVLRMIETAKRRAYSAANTVVIDLYWNLGEYISQKAEAAGWGQGTVANLAGSIQRRQPGRMGFSASNLWRMRQFFATYSGAPRLAPLVRELPWTHNLLIMGRCKRDEEREFYLRLATREKWGKRELERQLAGALFERVVLSPPKLAPAVREIHPDAENNFKDTYLFEFLELPPDHSEAELERALVEKLRQFLIELGRDFCFVGSQYPVQVGGRDFAIDLLFFNRALNCLVAIELKIDQFQPEHLGKLEFYLEALDRDVKKPHEQPSIGVLLCATKDSEVVEYALSRAASPALVAEYRTRLPDKKLLQAKLHEFYTLAELQVDAAATDENEPRPAGKLPSIAKPRKSSKR
jgi:predicted nuclease of restriction endonuclease-like (RecB) superfamily